MVKPHHDTRHWGLHDWMLAQRDLVPNGSATAKALDYCLKHWVALTRRTGCLPGRYAAVSRLRQS